MPSAMLVFFRKVICKSIVYGIISHDSIETKRTRTRYDHFLSVYIKLDVYMAYRYVFQPLKTLLA